MERESVTVTIKSRIDRRTHASAKFGLNFTLEKEVNHFLDYHKSVNHASRYPGEEKWRRKTYATIGPDPSLRKGLSDALCKLRKSAEWINGNEMQRIRQNEEVLKRFNARRAAKRKHTSTESDGEDSESTRKTQAWEAANAPQPALKGTRKPASQHVEPRAHKTPKVVTGVLRDFSIPYEFAPVGGKVPANRCVRVSPPLAHIPES